VARQRTNVYFGFRGHDFFGDEFMVYGVVKKEAAGMCLIWSAGARLERWSDWSDGAVGAMERLEYVFFFDMRWGEIWRWATSTDARRQASGNHTHAEAFTAGRGKGEARGVK
jgi:hypothetical protein